MRVLDCSTGVCSDLVASGRSERDYSFVGATSPSLQEEYRIPHAQKKRIQIGGTCGGNAGAYAIGAAYDVAWLRASSSNSLDDVESAHEMRQALALDGLFGEELSGSGLWAMAQLFYRQMTDPKEGITLRAMLWCALRRGVPTRKQHPEEELLPPTAKTLGGLATAKIEFARIEGDLPSGCESAVRADALVIIAGDVGKGFEDAEDGGLVDADEGVGPHGLVLDRVRYVDGRRELGGPEWWGRESLHYSDSWLRRRCWEGWTVRVVLPRA